MVFCAVQLVFPEPGILAGRLRASPWEPFPARPSQPSEMVSKRDMKFPEKKGVEMLEMKKQLPGQNKNPRKFNGASLKHRSLGH